MLGLVRGKRMDTREWVTGFYHFKDIGEVGKSIRQALILPTGESNSVTVLSDTVGAYTGVQLNEQVCVGDIIRYTLSHGFVCTAVVRFGSYLQDGSGGEYSPSECFGFYVEVLRFRSAAFVDVERDDFPMYRRYESLTALVDEMHDTWVDIDPVNECVVLGNIWDNPECLEEGWSF